MGNSLCCSASGERLATAARDGDLGEARRLLELNPGLAKYSIFGGFNSSLHLAAADGRTEIAKLLLEKGADVNSRNICGQTPLMHACRSGHWDIVQILLLFRCDVLKVEYLNSRTALHFAAEGGHVRCIRLLVADFSCGASVSSKDGAQEGSIPKSSLRRGYDQLALSKFVNKAANGGVTALHLAALNGHFDCVHLLLDLHADVSSVALYYSSSTSSIGAGSTPLHYAACGGNLKCCQVLIARGASRSTENYNGWLPCDVARMWGCHSLEPLLSPNSDFTIPLFRPSNYLSLPLRSILDIARDCGLQSSPATSDGDDLCAVCLERVCTVACEGCGHELCITCALCLCSTSKTTPETDARPGSIPCPFCRNGIVSFVKLPTFPPKELKLNQELSLCIKCSFDPHDLRRTAIACKSEFLKNT
ncbi:probable E3 ubiquitin-protein ligase XBOS33 isoform X2 [Phoenix dactylifera]|uniref:RING-type E3 ubiquitin transferase n=1 Tax=Phoenix dactylifera TaxID=42345 RepID=A0A8B7CNR9_PHODC|nr:probable E3 ubiquitin-protein ligase XBOS33 isoform X2 [Phoenix dactylifera]